MATVPARSTRRLEPSQPKVIRAGIVPSMASNLVINRMSVNTGTPDHFWRQPPILVSESLSRQDLFLTIREWPPIAPGCDITLYY